ncbi:MAG: mannose-1-phosphate guanylyltransferase [Clostridia bacterium]|nr:mannose-1-phosphate guanylyltransferase [Clostridia bacterium]
MKKVAVIMAGGRGERLWPKSRAERPKQFLALGGGEDSMIRLTVKRMLKLTAIENIFIVTGSAYFDLTHEQLPSLPVENILCEPEAKNTTACIGFAAEVVKKRYAEDMKQDGDIIMMVLPSDHMINDTDAFVRDMEKCCEIAEEGKTIVTVGISPTRPETGFGYIKVDKKRPVENRVNAWKMSKFVEKPEFSVAKRYVASGSYFWNAGMFVFPVGYMLRCIKRFHPHNATCLAAIGKSLGKKTEKQTIARMFAKMESISIDYAVMEHIRGSITVSSTFDWNDVGTWAAIPEIQQPDGQGNYITGRAVVYDSTGCIVEMPKGKAVAILGVSNLVIVESENALLVCHKDYAQKIKEATKKFVDEPQYL